MAIAALTNANLENNLIDFDRYGHLRYYGILLNMLAPLIDYSSLEIVLGIWEVSQNVSRESFPIQS